MKWRVDGSKPWQHKSILFTNQEGSFHGFVLRQQPGLWTAGLPQCGRFCIRTVAIVLPPICYFSCNSQAEYTSPSVCVHEWNPWRQAGAQRITSNMQTEHEYDYHKRYLQCVVWGQRYTPGNTQGRKKATSSCSPAPDEKHNYNVIYYNSIFSISPSNCST